MPSSAAHRFLLFCCLLTILFSSSQACRHAKETHLRLYMHAVMGGPNATTRTIIDPGTSSYSFGLTRVIDHELRVSGDPTSELVGRVQGLAVESSLAETQSVLLAVNTVFIAGRYNNSVINMFGRRSVPRTNHTISIIGGSGKFLMAQGYIAHRTYNASGVHVVVQMDYYIKYHCPKKIMLPSLSY